MSSSGTVKYFNSEKGFGFIQPQDGSEDLFVHVSGIVDGKIPQSGDTCCFEIEHDDRKGKFRAVNVTGGSGVPVGSRGGKGSGKGGNGGGGYGSQRTSRAFDPATQVYIKRNKQIIEASKDRRTFLDLFDSFSKNRAKLNVVNIATTLQRAGKLQLGLA